MLQHALLCWLHELPVNNFWYKVQRSWTVNTATIHQNCGRICKGMQAWCDLQVLQEPGLTKKQQYTRAKAVKKLGSIFSQINKPRNPGGVTNIMEEFSDILMVKLWRGIAPSLLLLLT